MTSGRPEKDLDALNGRFIEAMEAFGHTGYSLSKELGTSEAVISNIRNRKNPPNIQLVRALLNKYLDLDPEWLLFGRGGMRKESGSRPADQDSGSLQAIERRMGLLEELIRRSLHTQLERSIVEDESLADLDERMASLERQLEALKKDPGKRK